MCAPEIVATEVSVATAVRESSRDALNLLEADDDATADDDALPLSALE